MVKAKAIRQAEVDAREAAEVAEKEVQDAAQSVREKHTVEFRLILWLMRYVWPRLSKEERAEVRSIIPEGMETEIKDALKKLP